MLQRLSLRLRIFLLFAGMAGGALAAVGAGLWLGYQRQGGADGSVNAYVQAGVIATLGILGAIAWVWYLFDVHLAKPIDQLAGALRARAHTDVSDPVAPDMARYLGDLAPAASAASQSLAQTRDALAEAVSRETRQLRDEKTRLEAMLSDVGAGVLMCSGAHLLVFYNAQAADLLGVGTHRAGLDRDLFDYLRPGPLRLAYDRLLATGDPHAASDLICTSGSGARVFLARMRLMAATDKAAGYVLTLRDITADLAAQTRRAALLSEAFQNLRRAAANLSALTEVLPDTDDGPEPVTRALRAEVLGLSAALADLTRRHEEDRGENGFHTAIRALDLVEGLRARLEDDGFAVHPQSDDVMLRCNAFEIIALLSGLAEAIAGQTTARSFDLTLREDADGALIRLGWAGPALDLALLEAWLAAPLEPGLADVSRRSVLASHATDIWPEAGTGTASLCLPVAMTRRAVSRPAPVARPVIYDFDLLSKARGDKVQNAELGSLVYVVFDTETTGLQPGQGDELVQIAAVRIVNGRRIEGEVFDSLVQPGRRIPPGSTAVHGITDAMVRDAPPVTEVLRRFHRFAQGAVLVAHNAPFDMAFLRRREADLDLRFDHPILDTVLLSAVIFGQHETHSLDALTHRLGITIPEEARHTALGDTEATAEAFLKLLAMLQGRGLTTFGAVLSEVRRHGRLLKDLN